MRVSIILVLILLLVGANGFSQGLLSEVSGVVKIEKEVNGKNTEEVVVGAVIIFTDQGNNEFRIKSAENGIYKINLPKGKYRIYATVNDKCWMCSEYYKNDFLVDEDKKVEQNILLHFYGEG